MLRELIPIPNPTYIHSRLLGSPLKEILDNPPADNNDYLPIVVSLISYGTDDSIEYSNGESCRDVIIRRWGPGVYDRVESEILMRKIRYDICQMEEVEHVLSCVVLALEGNKQEKKNDCVDIDDNDSSSEDVSSFFVSLLEEVLDADRVIGEIVCPIMFNYDRGE